MLSGFQVLPSDSSSSSAMSLNRDKNSGRESINTDYSTGSRSSVVVSKDSVDGEASELS